MAFGIEAGGEGTDPGEELRVGKTDEQALMAAHGKTGDGAVLALLRGVIVGPSICGITSVTSAFS